MAVKNIVAKAWSITPSFDGLLYSLYPTGNKPSSFVTTPTLIATDITSGSLNGGENNKGAYISLFGYSVGRIADLGTSTGVKVYFRDPIGDNTWHEVDNYRSLGKSRTYARNQAAKIVVQIGSLGGAMVAGRALDIKVTVNGVDSNILTGGFIIQPGNFFFVSLSGSDSTGIKNDITHPFRYAQQANGGSTFTGVWDPTTGLKAGDTIVLRGGSWSDQVGFEGKWIRMQAHTGTAPTGTTGNGYIHIVSYPGEDVHFSVPASGAGAIMGCSSTRSSQGYGKYVSVSGLRIDVNATAASDSAPINFQTNSDYWRVVDCELGPWPSTLVTPNNAKAGGLAGSSVGAKILFNNIHDINCDTNNPGSSALENHGIYFDAGQTTPSANCEVAYNWIHDIPGGSHIQWQDTIGGMMTGFKVHNNYLDTAMKYGLNFGPGTQSVDVYNNIIVGANRNAIRWAVDAVSGTAINIVHNTIRMGASTNAYKAAITQESNAMSAGAIRIQHNIVTLTSGAGAAGTDYIDFGASVTAPNATVAQNLYFDESAIKTTVPTKDASGIYGDPKFSNVAAKDLTCLTGGAGLAACTLAESIAVAIDYYGIARPVTGTGTPGATKNDIGATQGVGT